MKLPPNIPYDDNPPTAERIRARIAVSKLLSKRGHRLDGWEILQIERILHVGPLPSDELE